VDTVEYARGHGDVLLHQHVMPDNTAT
jgi:hypothetical protein